MTDRSPSPSSRRWPSAGCPKDRSCSRANSHPSILADPGVARPLSPETDVPGSANTKAGRAPRLASPLLQPRPLTLLQPSLRTGCGQRAGTLRPEAKGSPLAARHVPWNICGQRESSGLCGLSPQLFLVLDVALWARGLDSSSVLWGYREYPLKGLSG